MLQLPAAPTTGHAYCTSLRLTPSCLCAQTAPVNLSHITSTSASQPLHNPLSTTLPPRLDALQPTPAKPSVPPPAATQATSPPANTLLPEASLQSHFTIPHGPSTNVSLPNAAARHSKRRPSSSNSPRVPNAVPQIHSATLRPQQNHLSAAQGGGTPAAAAAIATAAVAAARPAIAGGLLTGRGNRRLAARSAVGRAVVSSSLDRHKLPEGGQRLFAGFVRDLPRQQYPEVDTTYQE